MTKKALIIDDEKPLLDIISEVLLLLNIESVKSRSGKDAVELAKVHDAFDVILVDMNMPEMNGKEAYMELKKLIHKVLLFLCLAMILVIKYRRWIFLFLTSF